MLDMLKNDDRLVLLNGASPKSLITEEWDMKLESDSGLLDSSVWSEYTAWEGKRIKKINKSSQPIQKIITTH